MERWDFRGNAEDASQPRVSPGVGRRGGVTVVEVSYCVHYAAIHCGNGREVES